jgi:hypothetical protein
MSRQAAPSVAQLPRPPLCKFQRNALVCARFEGELVQAHFYGVMTMSDMNFQLLLPQLFHDLMAYLGEHPAVLTAIGVFVILAMVGAWYVVSHHLHVLLVTMLCAAGFAAGAIVLYRGYQMALKDLIAIGAFLMIIFPVIYQQAVKVAKIAYPTRSIAGPEAMSKAHAKRAGA